MARAHTFGAERELDTLVRLRGRPSTALATRSARFTNLSPSSSEGRIASRLRKLKAALRSGGLSMSPLADAGQCRAPGGVLFDETMDKHPFGSTQRLVPVVGQGTWYVDEADHVVAIAALRRGLNLGMTHIDTAEMYGDAEEVVAKAIASRRDEVFLVSKVLPQKASRAGVRQACERSLARLGTDRLDCYLLHWRGSHPLDDTFEGFEALRREGKIMSWG
jgi:hypothetical protein